MSNERELLFRVRLLEEVSSTNDEVKRALDDGEPEGLVVRARRQVAGYGRQGRVWTSPEGGLYCSLLLRPQVAPHELPTLSLVVGMAVRRALVALAGDAAAESVRIKWPNDVVVLDSCEPNVAQNRRYEQYVAYAEKRDLGLSECEASEKRNNRPYRRFCAFKDTAGTSQNASTPVMAKLCGISLEAHGGGVCVGVGVNVVPPAERPDVGGKNRAAYVNDLMAPLLPSVSIEDVLAAFLDAFAPLYGAWTNDGFAPMADEFNAHASLIGRSVSVVDHFGETLWDGRVERIDAWGRLLLRDETGAQIPVCSGEAHLV